MHSSRSAKIGAAVTAAAALVALPVAASAAPSGGSAADTPSRATVTHLLAQQGLDVGAANQLFQGSALEFQLALSGASSVGMCEPFGSGSYEVVSDDTSTPGTALLEDVIYYDADCTTPFISQNVVLTESGTEQSLAFTGTGPWKITAPDGSALGRFSGTLRFHATNLGGDNATVTLANGGNFLPKGAKLPVHLGLGCTITESQTTSNSQKYTCTAGVAQKFTDLGSSLASTTPITYRVTTGTDLTTTSATMHGRGAQLFAGKKALGVKVSKAAAVSVTGTKSDQGTDRIKGEYAQFSLFSPPQTDWTITNTKAHQQFTIAVTGDDYALAGSVVDTDSGAKYANIKLDESGSGTVHYAGRKQAVAVTNWTLAG